MRKTLVLLTIAALALALAGCLEIDVKVQMFEPGQGVIVHEVRLPAATFNMQAMSMHLTSDQLEQKLSGLATADAAVIAGLQVGRATIRSDGEEITLSRVFLFQDEKALASYLNLLGLKAVLERKTSGLFTKRLAGCALKVDAATLDAKVLARLGDALAQAPATIPATLRLIATLPGRVESVVPANSAAGHTAAWEIPSDRFNQAFHAEFVTRVPKPREAELGEPAPFDGTAVDAIIGGLASSAYLQRLGNRSFPLLHLRLDKKLNADLSVLWVADDITENMAAYHQQVDELLLPELRANYYDWLERVTLGAQTYLAGGWRARETVPAKKLTGALAVRREGDRIVVSFTPPRMLNAPDNQNDSPERIVAAVLVTFPDGREETIFVRVKHLRAGETIEVAR